MGEATGGGGGADGGNGGTSCGYEPCTLDDGGGGGGGGRIKIFYSSGIISASVSVAGGAGSLYGQNGEGGSYYELLIVDIDIKPGSYPNAININGKGVIPVAILGSADFDVTQIDLSTLNFAGLAVRVKGNGQPQCSIEDVSGDFSTGLEGTPDGFDDLVCQFVDDPATWTVGNGSAILTGQLIDGAPFEGNDSIKIVSE